MMKRRVVAFAVLLAVHTAAWAGPEAKVRGWARGQNPHSVEVFDAQGVPREVQDLSGMAIVGRYPWDPEVGLVKLPGSRWVESKVLDVVFCETAAKQSFAGQATSGAAGAKIYGSGGRCDPE